jgi:hypothetical protein
LTLRAWIDFTVPAGSTSDFKVEELRDTTV